MKRLILTLLLTACVVLVSPAQRRTSGTSRDPQAGGTNSSERPARTQDTKKDTPPPADDHESGFGSGISILILGDNPSRPSAEDVSVKTTTEEDGDESSEAILYDNSISPGHSGFDFSDEESGDYQDKKVDVYLSKTGDQRELVVGADTDIQDLGQVSFQKIETIPGSWSPTHRVAAEAGNTYIVWTWDNQYYRFNIEILSDEQASVHWIKMDGGARIASNVAFRDGIHHLKKSRFGR